MSSVNKVILMGRVGKDPEVKHFENGGAICNFSMATKETWKDKSTGEKKERTDWHNCSCNLPNLVTVISKYVKKGDALYVEGKNRTRSWEKDGKTTYITEVIIDNVVLMANKRSDDGGYDQSGSTSQTSAPTAGGVASDDLPF